MHLWRRQARLLPTYGLYTPVIYSILSIAWVPYVRHGYRRYDPVVKEGGRPNRIFAFGRVTLAFPLLTLLTMLGAARSYLTSSALSSSLEPVTGFSRTKK